MLLALKFLVVVELTLNDVVLVVLIVVLVVVLVVDLVGVGSVKRMGEVSVV